jgi:hypothetical protein
MVGVLEGLTKQTIKLPVRRTCTTHSIEASSSAKPLPPIFEHDTSVNMQMPQDPNVTCVEISENLLESVADCLFRNFPRRPREEWIAGLRQMSTRPRIGNYPRFGFMLSHDGRTVGVLLTIYSRDEADNVRCCLSSWCVDPDYRARGGGLKLHLKAVSGHQVTYLNISPAAHTRPVIEALGFLPWSEGQFMAAPGLARPAPTLQISDYSPHDSVVTKMTKFERDNLTSLQTQGCRILICRSGEDAYPLGFLRRRVFRGLVPCAQLVYCRDMDEFMRAAGAVGRYLFFWSGPFVLIDATAPIKSLVGRYFPGRNSRYFRGPVRPRLGDLSETELTVFGG